MTYLDREDMAEDLRERYDALTDYEQRAVCAILEVLDYGDLPDSDNPDECALMAALEYVESGDYEFYDDVATMADLAYKLVHEHDLFFAVDTYCLDKLLPYIDYEKLGLDLYNEGYCDTSYGVINFW